MLALPSGVVLSPRVFLRPAWYRSVLVAGLAMAAAGCAVADEHYPAFLKPCRLDGLEHEALCGVVARPLNPARPGGPSIDLHVAVVPALARNRWPDPVFFLAGGPGQSAIDLAGPVAGLLSRFLNRRDLVLVDQRGTGRSAPLTCEAEEPDRMQPLAESADPARQRQRLADCRTRLQALPHGDLRHYTTAHAAADLDAVRQALGVQQINVVGASYGTRLALEVQRRFPGQVRRAVLDGVAPPDMRLPESFGADNQAALDAVWAACEADAACNARHPGLRATWQQLVASLPREVTLAHPTTGRPETLVLTRDMLLGLVRSPLYVPALAAGLPAAVQAARDGRFEALAALADVAAPGRLGAVAMGMHFSVVCTEDVPVPGGAPAAAATAAGEFGDSFAAMYRDVCADWPRGTVPQGFRDVPAARHAVLLLSGGVDPVTPPRHGDRVARDLGSQARHVVVPQAGHGLLSVGCLRDVVFRFVDAPTDAAALQVDAGCAAAIPRPPAMAWPPGPKGQP